MFGTLCYELRPDVTAALAHFVVVVVGGGAKGA